MSTLSEDASKRLLATYGIPITPERVVADADGAALAADELGYPVVAKLCGDAIAHKSERGLVRLGLTSAADVRQTATELLAARRDDDGEVGVLVAPMVAGRRELIVGLVHDPQFGPTVMVGIGGIFTEALADVAFRPVPVATVDADEMIDQLRTSRLLGALRGEAAVDRPALARVLVALSDLAEARPDIRSVDVNPLIVDAHGALHAVDALVEVEDAPTPSTLTATTAATQAVPPAAGATVEETVDAPPQPVRDEQFRALFEPTRVLVAGASSHPGKFGFVSLHNLLAGGFPGEVRATNRAGGEVLGIECATDVAELPDDSIDLVVVCTPAAANEELLRACAAKGAKAAFVTSAGYGEAGEAGRAAERSLVRVARSVGVLVAGPNGQGVVSPPARLCAQIVAPNPPPGAIAVVSQSGNFVSSFLNYSRQTDVGISRAISAGNAADVTPADYLSWYASDPATRVALAYVEGITDGPALRSAFATVTARKPLVVVKGGASALGARAAASHTGALAADDAVFEGVCRHHGVTRAATVDEAFEAAATFATQPLPRGPRVVILTTVGGWGVVTSDAIAAEEGLELLTLPDDLRALIDTKLPPRWSRNNPVDCAGGETRDTIPEVMEAIAAHPDVDAIVYLGLGIQSNQARMMREGPFYPDHGLKRIVDYHERQDRRFAHAAAALSERYDKPILTATELAVADPHNPGPAAVRASGRLCYPSGHRAVRALGHLWRYARFRSRR